jgi:hypothetical protein
MMPVSVDNRRKDTMPQIHWTPETERLVELADAHRRGRPFHGFHLDGVHVRTLQDWTVDKTTPKEHAERYGASGSWKADGTLVLCYWDDGMQKFRRLSIGHAIYSQVSGRYAPRFRPDVVIP